jgi:hypothetical protein
MGNLTSGIFENTSSGLAYAFEDGATTSVSMAKNGLTGFASDASQDEKFLLQATIDPLTHQTKVVYDIGAKVIEALIAKGIISPLMQWGKQTGERMRNYLLGFDFRTDSEITADRTLKIEAAHAIAKDGDLIFGNGDTVFDYGVKAGDRNFANFGNGAPAESRGAGTFVDHVGIVKLDPVTNEKYVVETNPGGFRYTKLDDFIARYRDFEINRPKPDLNASAVANYLFQYVNRDTGGAAVGAPSYDYLGLFGLSGSEATSDHPRKLFCSSAVYNGFYNTRKGRAETLPGVNGNFRISPQDIWKGREEWDESLIEIYTQGQSS